MSAIAGIDQALWDIKGKFYNAPIHQLLGGKARDTMKVYSWIGGDRPADVGLAAKQIISHGFKAVKMNATEELQYVDSHKKIDEAIERIAAVRDAVGPDIGIGIDFHGRVHISICQKTFELPPGEHSFTRCDRNGNMISDFPQGFVVFGKHRLLNKHWMKWLQFFC